MVDHPDAPLLLKEYEQKRKEVEPEVNQWICMIFLIFDIGIMAATTVWVGVVT
jgi:Ca2+:H+ antiporter